MIALRDYQEEALAAVQASSKSRQLVALPTGTGKTVVFSELIRRRGGTALILAHRDELLQQAHAKLTTVAPELAMSVGFVQAERNDVGSPVVVASIQTLARQSRLDQLPHEFGTVVIDEAHHATAVSYRRVVDHVQQSPLIVGFTATPERADKSRLGDVFEDIVYARSMEEMIREGYLCNMRGERVVLEDLDLSTVKKSRGDFQADDLGRALEAADAVEHAVGAYTERAAGRRAIAFFPTVALSASAAAAFQGAGYRAAHIDGETPRDQRRQILRSLSAGELDVVSNVGVLTEGFDEPSLDCVIVAAPTKSRVKYAQMVGRGTRTYPGKDDCLVLDLAGVSDELTVQSIGVLFGLKKPLKRDETITEALDHQAVADAKTEAQVERKREYDRARRKARSVELFSRERIHWLRLGGRWVVSAQEQLLVVDQVDPESAAGWRVLSVGKDSAQVVAKNLDFGYAEGVVETLVRDAGAEVLVDREAPWRELEASEGQRKFLRSLHLQAPAELTKGDAADLITAALAEQRLARLDRALARRAERQEVGAS